MKISSLFNKGKTVFSFEVFPPKKSSPIDTIYKTLDELRDLSPDFISVTYGAGGNSTDTGTVDIASLIKTKYQIEPLAHLTCLNSTRSDIASILSTLKENNVENILALRGDINPNITAKDDFKYASELIDFIKNNGDFGLAGACYPECHLDSSNVVDDIVNLKKKVDAGVDHLISQLFFDNSAFYNFVEKARIAGITVPIQAGIMPVTNTNQIQRMVTMCGASLPTKFSKIMQRFDNSPTALQDAGIAYAIDQIVDLLAHDVDGIHLYTMNNSLVARRISESISSMLR